MNSIQLLFQALLTQQTGGGGGGGPVVPGELFPAIMLWRAADLGDTEAEVSHWPNLGTGGRAYDLLLGYSVHGPSYTKPLYVPAAAGNPAHVEFRGSYLETAQLVPATLAGNKSRTIGVLVYMENDAQANILGYGATDTGRMFDVMTYAGGYLIPHAYAVELSATPWVMGRYVWLEVVIVEKPAPAQAIEFVVYRDNKPLQTASQTWPVGGVETTLDTAISKLVLGAGMYSAYNSLALRRIVGAYVADKPLTAAERAQCRQGISKGIKQALHSLPALSQAFNPPLIPDAQDVRITMRVRPTSTNNGYLWNCNGAYYLDTLGFYYHSQRWYFFILDAYIPAECAFYMGDGGTSPVDVFQTITIEKTAQTVRGYVDGVLMAEVPVPAGFRVESLTNLHMGFRGGGGGGGEAAADVDFLEIVVGADTWFRFDFNETQTMFPSNTGSIGGALTSSNHPPQYVTLT